MLALLTWIEDGGLQGSSESSPSSPGKKPATLALSAPLDVFQLQRILPQIEARGFGAVRM